ncbi:cytochrome c oxidase subunit 7A2, mitochondrial-like [Glandiceps talaboti]
MNRVLAVRNLVPRARTNLVTSKRGAQNKVYENQKLFQEPNNRPIHLKGGTFDNLLYKATIGSVIFGTLWTFYELGKACLPQQPK